MHHRPSRRTTLPGALAFALLLMSAASARADFSFVHITDTHVTATEAPESNAAKDAALYREISGLTPKPAFVVNTGDVCEVGTEQEYAVYRRSLKALDPAIKAYVAPGNHDVRWNPTGKEGYTKGSGQPLYQSWDYENIHFVLLDSTVLLQHWGHFDQAQLDWLARDLKKVGTERPVIIGFHHFFGRGGAEHVDNYRDLLDVLAPYNVRLFLIGHGHSDVQWSIGGIPAIMGKGLYQASYSLIEVKNGTLRVLRRTEQSPTPTQEVLTVSLARPKENLLAVKPLSASLFFQDNKTWLTVPGGSVPSGGAVTLEVGGKPVPMAVTPGKDGFTAVADGPLGLIPGTHHLTLTVTLPGENAAPRSLPVTLTLEPPADRKPVWKAKVKGAVQTKLVRAGNLLYVPTMDGYLHALDAATGREKWQYRTGGPIFSVPLVADGAVYVGSADHSVYCLDAATGKLKWKSKTGGGVFAGAAKAKGIVCIVSTDRKAYGLDAATGKVRWTSPVESLYQSQAVTDGERFFLGGWDRQFRCLDAATGAEQWKHTFGRSFYYSPAIGSPTLGGGKAFVTSNDGILHAVDIASGKLVWESQPHSLGYSGPLYHEGKIYNASLTDTGRVFRFDAETGKEEWETPTGSVIYDSSCVRSGDTIFVGSVNGTFSALKTDGSLQWQYRLDAGHVLCSPAADDQRVYIGGMNGTVYAFPAR